MLVSVWAGSECLWNGEAPELMMGVRVGDELDVPGLSKWDVKLVRVKGRRVSLVDDADGCPPEVVLRLEVEVG